MESVSPGAYEFFINVNRIFKDPTYFPENPYYIEFLISQSINLRLRFIIRSLPSQYLLPAIPSQLEFNQMEFRKVEMTAMVVLSDGSVVNVELANSEPPDFKAPVVAEWGYFD